jgi:hypothetical protein
MDAFVTAQRIVIQRFWRAAMDEDDDAEDLENLLRRNEFNESLPGGYVFESQREWREEQHAKECALAANAQRLGRRRRETESLYAAQIDQMDDMALAEIFDELGLMEPWNKFGRRCLPMARSLVAEELRRRAKSG